MREAAEAPDDPLVVARIGQNWRRERVDEEDAALLLGDRLRMFRTAGT